MISCRRLQSLPPLSVLALLAALALPAASQAKNKPKPPPPQHGTPPQPHHGTPPHPHHGEAPHPHHRKAPHPAQCRLHLQEAAALRKAFVALAGANHNYDGHRWKAMLAVKAALPHLDELVLKHGAAGQKAATSQGRAAVAQAEEAARRAATVHEPQSASDAQLRLAAYLLQQVRRTLVANKQQNVLGHVDAAIREIVEALKVR
jgi:hypothetical protein